MIDVKTINEITGKILQKEALISVLEKRIIEIGFDKDGEADFRISAEVGNLSLDQMDSLRKMIVVGIGTTEDMFRRSRENKTEAGKEDIEIYRTDIPPGYFP